MTQASSSVQAISDQARQYRVFHEKCLQTKTGLPRELIALNQAIVELYKTMPTHAEWPSLRAEVSKQARLVARDDAIQAGPLVHVRQVLRILESRRSGEESTRRAINDLAPIAAQFLPPEPLTN